MKPKANTRLKRERELRGWSQEKVAMELGIDPTTVGRWERGVSLPYPHFREKLCALFGKSTYELGLVPKEANEQHLQPETGHSPSSSLALYDPAIPPQSVGSTGLVGREKHTAQLKQKLCKEHVPYIGLNGLPGVGKTTLALQLVYDSEVRACFQDGILWAGLGPKPHIASHLSRWGTLLGIHPDILKQNNSNEALAKQVRAAIGMKRMLLIIDDVWTLEDAFAFKVEGPNCVCLITTRFPPLALAFAEREATVVRELNEEESIALLTSFVPKVATEEKEKIQTLARSVGGLPLALTLMGNYLRVQSYDGQSRRLHTALERLHNENERLHLSTPRGVLDRHTSLAHNTPLSLQTIIAISDKHLSEKAHSALCALSVLPAKPNTFSEEAALAISAHTTDVLDELCDAGLLECSNYDRYTLHQTIADYARTKLHDTAVYQRFVTYFTQFVEAHEKDYAALENECDTILAALDVAFAHGMEEAYVNGINLFAFFLCMRGLYSLAESRLQRAHQVATALDDMRGATVALLHLGEIAEKRGDYPLAEVHFQNGLTLAYRSNRREYIALLLAKLGNIAYHRGDKAQIEEYIREGSTLKDQIEDKSRISLFLVTLGVKAKNQGDIAQAEVYFQEGLTLARQDENKEQICLLLLHLSGLAEHRGDFVTVGVTAEEGLQQAREIGHFESMVMFLLALGILAEHRQAYTEAEAYFVEGLQLARQIGNPIRVGILLVRLSKRVAQKGEYDRATAYYQEALALTYHVKHTPLRAAVLVAWGETYMQYQQVDAAETAFKEALALVTGTHQEFHAQANYGLAQVTAMKNNPVEARKLGEASLKTFETVGHYKALEVKAWLDMLPKEVNY